MNPRRFGGAVIALLLLAPTARAEESAGELRARANTYTASLTRASTHVQGLLRAARSRGATPQIRCVDESLSRVDTAARAASAAQRSLFAALDRADRSEAEVDLVRVRAAYERGREAAASADVCAGLRAPLSPSVAEGTEVRMTIDGALPGAAALAIAASP